MKTLQKSTAMIVFEILKTEESITLQLAVLEVIKFDLVILLNQTQRCFVGTKLIDTIPLEF